MKLFVEIYKRLYRYFMAIHIRLWVGTLYLLLKGDLGIARKVVSRHFIKFIYIVVGQSCCQAKEDS